MGADQNPVTTRLPNEVALAVTKTAAVVAATMASNVAVVARVWPATPRQGCNQDSQDPDHHLGRAHGGHTPFFGVRGCRDTVMHLLAVPLNAATTPWRRRRRHTGKVGQRPPLEHSGRKVHAKDQQQWALQGHKDEQESPVTPAH